jgi:membrane protease YdiL (CAAX protease family)
LTPRLGRLGAIAISTALFAALHLEPARIIATAIVGGAAGAVAAWSRSLVPAIALHAVNNAIVAALSLGHAPSLRRAIDHHAAATLAIAVALAIGGLAVVRATSPRGSATVQP